MSDDVVANFMAITNCQDEETAISVLAACDFSLHAAIDLYNSSVGKLEEEDEVNQPVQPQASTRQHDPKRAAAPPAQHRVTRLVDADGDTPPRLGVESALRRLQQHIGSAQHDVHDELDDQNVFQSRNVPHVGRRGQARAPVVVQRRETGGGEVDDLSPALDGLFRSPKYASTEDFAYVCSRARNKRQWVLLNILRQGDFKSACMNRDLWRDQLISEIIPQMFTFCQYTSSSSIGAELAAQYHLQGAQLPCLLIINPITRALIQPLNLDKIKQGGSSGMAFSSEILLEKLTEFIEKTGQPELPPDFDSIPDATLAQQQQQHSGGPTPLPASDVDVDADEDEQLQRALALSMEVQNGGKTPTIPSRAVTGQGPRRDRREGGATPNTTFVDEYDVDEPISLDESTQSPATKLSRQELPAVPTHPPAAVNVPPVDMSPYMQTSADAFRIRLKLPGGVADLSLAPSTPVVELQRFATYKIFTHMQNTTQQQVVAAVPVVEFLAGFPPTRVPFDNSTTLQTWQGVRRGDALVVHQT